MQTLGLSGVRLRAGEEVKVSKMFLTIKQNLYILKQVS